VLGAQMGRAQSDPNPAMNNPDKLAWTLFFTIATDAKTSGNNNATFETWASDAETFNPKPVWPTTPLPLDLKPRALSTIKNQRFMTPANGPQVVPGGDVTEETRRNKADFDFIVQNNLFKVSGLKAAFAANKTLSFPLDSLEVKANWVDVTKLGGQGFSGTPAEAAKVYHVNSAGGKTYALVSFHVISKLVPNWTWATFEHKNNPGRCDVIGCRDAFGATQTYVAPLSPVESRTPYPDCVKTDALKALFASAKVDPAFQNYCLKGSQSDFTDPTGLAIRVGNSVTEQGFVDEASCMTCHARAAWDVTGKATTCAGFDSASANLPPCTQGNNTTDAPVGPVNPGWFFAAGSPPSMPILQYGKNQPIAVAADFVWSVPFCAIDDTATPPKTKSRCSGK